MKRIFSFLLIYLIFLNQNLQSNDFGFEYELNYPIFSGGIALFSFGAYSRVNSNNYENSIKISNTSFLNRNLDNYFDYEYDKGLSRASDLLLLALVAAPTVYTLRDGFTNDFWQTNLIYLQAQLYNVGINLVTKDLIYRERPFYKFQSKNNNNNIRNPRNYESFYSGHATIAFSSATFLGLIYENSVTNGRFRGLIWTGALVTASTVAGLRVLSGKHYISDVIIGAIVGSAIAYFTAESYKKQNNSELLPTNSLNLSFKL